LIIQKSIRKFIKDTKAISPIIATLLLIAIAVAASVITYSWVMSMIASQSQQAQTQIRIDAVEFKNSAGLGPDAIALTIRNTGSVAATIESVSITLHEKTTVATLSSKITIQTGSAGTYSFKAGQDNVPASWKWSVQEDYTIRTTCTTGFFYDRLSVSPSSIPSAG